MPKTPSRAAKNVDKNQTIKFKHVFSAWNPGVIDDYYKVDKKVLGEGSYGRVSKGKDVSTGAVRAIKAIDRSKITDKKRFDNEVAVQQQLDHPNIVKLYEVFKDNRYYYLVMELCTGGELFDRIVAEAKKKQDGLAFSEKDAAEYMQQIMAAIKYLHENEVAHRDIKPENFMMESKDDDAEIKVIDFGLAKNYSGNEIMKTKAGTPYYVAPEVLTGSYREACDIWSCGVIMYILLCGYPPFFGDNDGQILRAVSSGLYEYPSPEWDGISKDAKDLITRMLTKKPADRATASQVYTHHWFQKVNANPNSVAIHPRLTSNLEKFSAASTLKRVALTVMSNLLTKEDIAELKDTFSALDRNSDGTLTTAEIKDGIARLSSREQFKGKVDVSEVLDVIDSDASGRIDYTEFIAAMLEKKQYSRKENIWSAFRVFDKDGDGFITYQELGKIIQTSDEQALTHLLDTHDMDGDGKISFNEFSKMILEE